MHVHSALPSLLLEAAVAVELAAAGVSDRAAVLRALGAAGPFDKHGDPVDPLVWRWRADAAWVLRADRPL